MRVVSAIAFSPANNSSMETSFETYINISLYRLQWRFDFVSGVSQLKHFQLLLDFAQEPRLITVSHDHRGTAP
jgi:hypothetical protein